MVKRDVMERGLSMLHSEAMCTKREAEFLYDFARSFKQPITWAEVGTWCGRSLWAAGCGLPRSSSIFGYDMFEGKLPKREGSEEIIQYAPPELVQGIAQSVELALRAVNQLNAYVQQYSSVDASRMFPDRSVDVLLVDAAHDYESVSHDLDAWLPKMKPGGTIIGHDYTERNPGVVRAFDERFQKQGIQIGGGTRYCWVKI